TAKIYLLSLHDALPISHKEYEAKFGFEPRAYGVQTMRYDVDHIGNVKGVYTQILEETDEGMMIVDGTERHWPADLVLLSIGFIGDRKSTRLNSSHVSIS